MALGTRGKSKSARSAVVTPAFARRSSAPRRVRVSSSPVRPVTYSCRSSTTRKGHTLASASTLEADLRTFDGDKTAKARKVGELVAERAKAAGVEAVVFDRGGNRYAGRVAAIADGAREGGLNL